MKPARCLLLLFLLTSCSHQGIVRVKQRENRQLLSYHNRIAILPLLVFGRLPNIRREGNLQLTFVETLSRQINKEKKEIAIQSFVQTNEILRDNRISYREVLVMDKKQLCSILGVDAVFIGQLDPGRYVQRGDQGVTMLGQIFDSRNGDLVWSKELTMLASSVYDTRFKMLNVTTADMARQLPY